MEFLHNLNRGVFMEVLEKKSTIFILDTNILLDMGRSPLYASVHFLNLLKTIQDRLWIPRQVYTEFEKNKMKVFGDISKRYDKLKRELQNKNQNFSQELEKTLSDAVARNYIGIEQLNQSIFGKTDEIGEVIEEFFSRESQKIEIKRFEDFRNELFDFVANLRVGREISVPERLGILSEGELRYKYQIPPGFKDEGKDKGNRNPQEKFGDLFLWKEIIELPGKKIFPSLTDIVFVTNDQKEDWFIDDKIHPYLLQEFKDISPNIDIHFMQGAEFYRSCSELNGTFEDDVLVEMFILQIIKEYADSEKIEQALKQEIAKYPSAYDAEDYKSFKINDCRIAKQSYVNNKLEVRYLIQLTMYFIGYDVDTVMDDLGRNKDVIYETEFSIQTLIYADLKMTFNHSSKHFENREFEIYKVLLPEPVY